MISILREKEKERRVPCDGGVCGVEPDSGLVVDVGLDGVTGALAVPPVPDPLTTRAKGPAPDATANAATCSGLFAAAGTGEWQVTGNLCGLTAVF